MRTAIRDSGLRHPGHAPADWQLIPGVSFGPKRDYLYAGDRLAVQLDWSEGESPVRKFVAVDHLNSTRAVVSDDGGDVTAEKIDYLPFGGILTGDPQPDTTHLFTGHERDTAEFASNLDYMHARYFSPILGRFLSVDPAQAGRIGNSQSWNRYSYAWNNPMNLVDPFGEDVSIQLSFTGDDWTDGDKAKVIAAVKAFWSELGVGDVHVIDSAISNETNSPLWNRGVASLEVNSAQSGQSHRGIVRAGEFLNSDVLKSREEALNAVANAINHEVFAHQFQLSPFDIGDYLTFDRQYDTPALNPAIRERYGTVADAWAWSDPRTRPAFVSGPLPVHTNDRVNAQSKLKSKQLSPPSSGPNRWWKLW